MLLYSRFNTIFLVDGYHCAPLENKCGLRQGDPLSPILYNLTIEPLLIKLRGNLRGIERPGSHLPFKLACFADDLCAVVRREEIWAYKNAMDQYAKAANAIVNEAKSISIPLGNQGQDPPIYRQIHENELVKYLGCPIPLSPAVEKEFWNDLTQRMERTVTSWKRRGLSLKGKTLLAQTCLFSKLAHAASAMPVPTSILTKTERIVSRFIWNNKRPKANRETMVAPIEEGGLNVMDLKTHCQLLHTKTIIKILLPSTPDPKGPWWPFWAWSQLYTALTPLNLNNIITLFPFCDIQAFPEIRKAIPQVWLKIMQALKTLPKTLDIEDLTLEQIIHLPILPPFTTSLTPSTVNKLIQNKFIKIGDFFHSHGARSSLTLIDRTAFDQKVSVTGPELSELARFFAKEIYKPIWLGQQIFSEPIHSKIREAYVRTPYDRHALNPLSDDPTARIWGPFDPTNNPIHPGLSWKVCGKALNSLPIAKCRREMRGSKPPSIPSQCKDLMGNHSASPLWRLINQIPIPRTRDTTWLMMRNRLETASKLSHFLEIPRNCPKCDTKWNTEHIFFLCPDAKPVWEVARKGMGQTFADTTRDAFIDQARLLFPNHWPDLASDKRLKSTVLTLYGASIQALWANHCKRIHDPSKSPPDPILHLRCTLSELYNTRFHKEKITHSQGQPMSRDPLPSFCTIANGRVSIRLDPP